MPVQPFVIYVQYISVPPTVTLHIGKALNLNDLEEGDDVYFECSIVANPPAYKVTWLHNVSHGSVQYIDILSFCQPARLSYSVINEDQLLKLGFVLLIQRNWHILMRLDINIFV